MLKNRSIIFPIVLLENLLLSTEDLKILDILVHPNLMTMMNVTLGDVVMLEKVMERAMKEVIEGEICQSIMIETG
jgi:hypothetical protein